MRRDMKILLVMMLLALLCASLGTTQSKSTATPLLEAHMLGTGMASPQGRHLYVRVSRDGQVEYEDERMKGPRLDYFIRRGRLSSAEIKALSDQLNEAGVLTLAKDYQPLDPPIDHAIDLTVSIMRADKPQTIVIRNFSPTSSKASEAYPAGLIDLLCKIERLRKGASFGITADATQWCKQ